MGLFIQYFLLNNERSFPKTKRKKIINFIMKVYYDFNFEIMILIMYYSTKRKQNQKQKQFHLYNNNDDN